MMIVRRSLFSPIVVPKVSHKSWTFQNILAKNSVFLTNKSLLL